MLKIIEDRISELEASMTNMASQHNIISFVLAELKSLLPRLQAVDAEIKPIVDAVAVVEPAVQPFAAIVDAIAAD